MTFNASLLGRAVLSRVAEGGSWLREVVADDRVISIETRLSRSQVDGHRTNQMAPIII